MNELQHQCTECGGVCPPDQEICDTCGLKISLAAAVEKNNRLEAENQELKARLAQYEQ